MAKGPLQIGWARGDITPPRKTLVQGQFHTRISDEVLSPLTATAFALEVCGDDGGTEQVVFVSCDLAADAFKADLLRELEGRCEDSTCASSRLTPPTLTPRRPWNAAGTRNPRTTPSS